MWHVEIIGWGLGMVLPIATRGSSSCRVCALLGVFHLWLVIGAAIFQMWVLLALNVLVLPALFRRYDCLRRHRANWQRFASTARAAKA